MKTTIPYLLVLALLHSFPVHADKLGRVMDELSRGLEQNQESMRRWDAAEESRRRADAQEKMLREQRWFDREIAPQFPTFVNDRFSQSWKDYLATPLNDGTDKKIGHRLAAARNRIDTQITLEILRTFYYKQVSDLTLSSSLTGSDPKLAVNVIPPANPAFVVYRQDFDEMFPKVADAFNKRYRNLKPATLEARECGTANAYFRRVSRTVVICYELAWQVGTQLAKVYGGLPSYPKFHRDWVWFVIFHEIGHLLLDGQATLGREEDNADLIAVYLMPERALQSALFAVAELHAPKRLPSLREYAGTHSVDGTRRANIACWIYGKNPSQLQDMLPILYSIGLSTDRLRDCPAEYTKQKVAVDRILRAYQ